MCFLFNDTATTEIYTLSLHDALPISNGQAGGLEGGCGLGAKRRAEVVPAVFGAELALQLVEVLPQAHAASHLRDWKSTRLNSNHANTSYPVFYFEKNTLPDL